MDKYKKLEDYGIIGNLDSCALVGKDGSIDWCCFPHMESPSVFAAILDAEKGGRFYLSPASDYSSRQSYIQDTNVLKTFFEADSGTAVITDFMPIKGWTTSDGLSHEAIFRKVEGRRGIVKMSFGFMPSFDYARADTKVEKTEQGFIAEGAGRKLFLSGSPGLKVDKEGVFGEFSIKEGESVWFYLQYEHTKQLSSKDCETLLESTRNFWTQWRHTCDLSECVFEGPWHNLAVRSSLILKLLAHLETGAIYAAPTTSIPEVIGGVRNWDYRFNWIRDASFTLQALYSLGHTWEANSHMEWFMKICQGFTDLSHIKIMFGISDDADLNEQILEHLSGYENSRPVRIGNGAADQKQLDIYGELINAVYEVSRYGEKISVGLWELMERIINYVSENWSTKDTSIWEVRGEPRHFVHSKLMCWVALDRGIKIAKLVGDEHPVNKWEKVRGNIQEAILEKGYSKRLNSFVQSFGSESLDCTSLLIPVMGFLPFDDPRVQGTIKAIMAQLMTENGLVFRYKSEDGLPGEEGAFLICSFWLVNALALSGKVEEAEKIFNKLLKFASPLGLLSEEIDPVTGRQLGNFPQAFSHIGLINSALYLGKARGRTQMGPEPMGK